jgi:CheY-like chemotaxis protein
VISKKALLQYRLTPGLPPVEGDATQLRQVVMNLITNASDALADQPGVVTITTGLEQLEAGWAGGSFHAGEIRPGAYVAIDVHDTGVGMDAATLQRIFDPFFTTKFHGRGLGLAATLGIVRGHHGAIRVDTAPGLGTTFRLYLPAIPGAVAAPEPTPVRGLEQAASRGTGALVLVVDDEAIVRDVTRRTLERGGYRVHLAENGRRALEALEQHRPEISLVLLDLTMPELSGEETFNLIQSRWPGLPVLLTSGYTAEVGTDRLQTGGLAGFIQKPYPAGELIAAVRRALVAE